MAISSKIAYLIFDGCLSSVILVNVLTSEIGEGPETVLVSGRLTV